MSRVEQEGLEPLEDKDLLEEIVRCLVDQPAQVRVEETKGDDSTLLIVHCAGNDRGKVIGREGRTMNAIRVILGRVAAVDGRKVYIQMAAGPGDRPRQVRSAA